MAGKVNALERKVSVHERNIAELVDSMAELLATPSEPPKRSIGFLTHEDTPNRPIGIEVTAVGKGVARKKIKGK